MATCRWFSGVCAQEEIAHGAHDPPIAIVERVQCDEPQVCQTCLDHRGLARGRIGP
jgi:hypothetical protein